MLGCLFVCSQLCEFLEIFVAISLQSNTYVWNIYRVRMESLLKYLLEQRYFQHSDEFSDFHLTNCDFCPLHQIDFWSKFEKRILKCSFFVFSFNIAKAKPFSMVSHNDDNSPAPVLPHPVLRTRLCMYVCMLFCISATNQSESFVHYSTFQFIHCLSSRCLLPKMKYECYRLK